VHLPEILKTISKILYKHHAKAIVVGGAVRDFFLGMETKDYDVEVYGLETMDELNGILGRFGSVNRVGKSFGVLKFFSDGEEYDFSFPRTEQKIGKGHRGFDVDVDGALSFKEATRRRDFTVNALGYDIEEKRFLDPFNAKEDMENRILRHIDDVSFVEDPLRVYRAVQFCARFRYALAEETKALCRYMVDEGMLEELPKERIYAEFKKLLLKAPKPSIGFELMRELGVLRYFPELEALIGVHQDPECHPEGDVWVHTMMSLDAMAGLCRLECPHSDNPNMDKEKLKMFFTTLCHDLGKAGTTTIDEEGNIRAIGHEEAGVVLARSFMYRLTDEHDLIESILPLVEHHCKPSQFYKDGTKDKEILNLATKVNIEELVTVAKADFLGCNTEESLRGHFKAGEWLLEKAKALKVQNKPLENLLQGRDLIALGLEPSAKFKTILAKVYELQIDGVLSTKEEAMAYVKKEFLAS